MRWLLQWALAVGLMMVALPASAAELTMADGSVISGELVAPNDDGTVIRRTSGGLSPRISWDRFSQATLTELANDPALKILVEAYIDAPKARWKPNLRSSWSRIPKARWHVRLGGPVCSPCSVPRQAGSSP